MKQKLGILKDQEKKRLLNGLEKLGENFLLKQ